MRNVPFWFLPGYKALSAMGLSQAALRINKVKRTIVSTSNRG